MIQTGTYIREIMALQCSDPQFNYSLEFLLCGASGNVCGLLKTLFPMAGTIIHSIMMDTKYSKTQFSATEQ